MTTTLRPLYTIARDIQLDMRAQCMAMKKHPAPSQRFYAAWPYLEAMRTIATCRDDYGADSGSSIVAYGLSNLSTYRGEYAKRYKAELKAHLEAVR